ncbi:MAG: addiction module protein [Candidatus Aureabacteria bacterium]|nr:addiction module protein [Candidatus Auribacterota bacterium]
MISTAKIAQMSREEKLQTMEAIWADLSKNDTEVASPAWHEDVLTETEARVAAGQEQIADWETAKRELKNRFK